MKKRFALLLCSVLLTVALAACGESPSVDPQAEALSAYREILEAAPALEGEPEELWDASFGYEENAAKFGKHYDTFALWDLDRDTVPELIALSVVNFRWAPVSVFRYAEGQAVLLHDPQDGEAPVTLWQNSSANGAYTLYLCEEGHVHSLWRGDTPLGQVTEDHAYALEGTGLRETDCPVGENENAVFFPDVAKANTPEGRDAVLH